MSRSLFGTDGVRGLTNTHPMTAELAMKLGAAAGRYFRRDQQDHRVVIGKDTRLSGYRTTLGMMLVVCIASSGVGLVNFNNLRWPSSRASPS